MNRSEYYQWLLHLYWEPLLLGLVAAFLLSPLSRLSESTRSNCALALSVILALRGALTHAINSHGDGNLGLGINSAFGLAFAMSRLRLESGRSPAGWVCALMHLLFAVQSAPRR